MLEAAGGEPGRRLPGFSMLVQAGKQRSHLFNVWCSEVMPHQAPRNPAHQAGVASLRDIRPVEGQHIFAGAGRQDGWHRDIRITRQGVQPQCLCAQVFEGAPARRCQPQHKAFSRACGHPEEQVGLEGVVIDLWILEVVLGQGFNGQAVQAAQPGL